MIFLEGEVHAYWDENVHDEVYIVRAGDPATEVTGMLPFSRMTAIHGHRTRSHMRCACCDFQFVCFPR